MKHILLKCILFLIYVPNRSEYISAFDSLSKTILLYKLCILTSRQIKFTIGQPIDVRESNNESGLTNSSDFQPFQMVLPLKSLNEIHLQEEHKRIKKSTYKSNRKLNAHEMRHKLKQLLTNISNTFNDMDWYFSLEQLENEAFDGGGHIVAKKKSKSNKDINSIHKDYEQSSDLFLDQFIRQMYEMNPFFIDKMRSRIDNEISSNKRRIRLAPATNVLDIGDPQNSNKKVPVKKSFIKTVQIRDSIPPYDELYGDYDKMTEANNNKKPSQEELNANYFKGQQVYNFDEGDISEPAILSTTVSTTPPEDFYEYVEYSKENDDDYDEDEQVKDIEEYEINQNIVDSAESSTAASSKLGLINFNNKGKQWRRHANSEFTKRNGINKFRGTRNSYN